MAVSDEFVMNALLGLSAFHLSWTSQSQTTETVASQHRVKALRGLQVAVSNFSKENSDAVLAATIILSWQSKDW
jgi:Fungal specific transcription factor domain